MSKERKLSEVTVALELYVSCRYILIAKILWQDYVNI